MQAPTVSAAVPAGSLLLGWVLVLVHEISETLERTLKPSCQHGCHNRKRRMATVAAVITYIWHTIVTSFYITLAAISLFLFYLSPIQIIADSGFSRVDV